MPPSTPPAAVRSTASLLSVRHRRRATAHQPKKPSLVAAGRPPSELPDPPHLLLRRSKYRLPPSRRACCRHHQPAAPPSSLLLRHRRSSRLSPSSEAAAATRSHRSSSPLFLLPPSSSPLPYLLFPSPPRCPIRHGRRSPPPSPTRAAAARCRPPHCHPPRFFHGHRSAINTAPSSSPSSCHHCRPWMPPRPPPISLLPSSARPCHPEPLIVGSVEPASSSAINAASKLSTSPLQISMAAILLLWLKPSAVSHLPSRYPLPPSSSPEAHRPSIVLRAPSPPPYLPSSPSLLLCRRPSAPLPSPCHRAPSASILLPSCHLLCSEISPCPMPSQPSTKSSNDEMSSGWDPWHSTDRSHPKQPIEEDSNMN